jgi:hypothetical protein
MRKVEIKNAEDSLAAGRRGGQFDRTGNLKETNIEYRIMNIECRRKPPFEILRFDILLFCGSLSRPGEVSYKKTEENLVAERHITFVPSHGERGVKR